MTNFQAVEFFLAVNGNGEIGASSLSAEKAVERLRFEHGPISGGLVTFLVRTEVPLPSKTRVLSIVSPCSGGEFGAAHFNSRKREECGEGQEEYSRPMTPTTTMDWSGSTEGTLNSDYFENWGDDMPPDHNADTPWLKDVDDALKAHRTK